MNPMNNLKDMKRLIVLIMVGAFAGGLSAQTGDTIWGRCTDYRYPAWYDECDYYTNDGGFIFGSVPVYFNTNEYEAPYGSLLAIRQSLPGPIALDGIAVMVSTRAQRYPSLSTERNNEYAILMSTDSNGIPGDTLALSRWDSATTRVMLLPQNIRAEQRGDTTNCMRDFEVFEARFPQPILVDSVFFIAGTFNSNERTIPDSIGVWRYKYRTTSYTLVKAYQNQCNLCMDGIMWINHTHNNGWGQLHSTRSAGPFLLIPAEFDLTVHTDDSLMGIATGSGTYRSGDPVIIAATPTQYCRFASWSDGSTDNPRVIHLYSDSTITATFTHDSSNYVRVLPNNPDWGSVSGAGIYPYGQSVDIAATPFDGYLFTEWADGNQDNPRTVYPTGDTVFTAIFDPVPVGISERGTQIPEFIITPNPTEGNIIIGCSEGSHVLIFYDGAGRPIVSHTFCGCTATLDVSTLPSGTYIAVLHTENMKEAKTLIKL